MKKIILIFFLIADCVYGQQHPISFATKKEFSEVSRQLKSNELLNTSFENIKNEVDPYLNSEIDVPFPKDPAGGYTHDQHKFLYNLMFNSGLMYQLTGNVKYAELVKNILLKYAMLNPTLKNHPQATSASPGRLFWQALNDANWLVYAGLAYDLVNELVNSEDKKTIAEKTFAPIVNYFLNDQKQWFNLIHNHAVWATAGVGIVGIACNNDNYLQMALYGTEKDGKSGYIANLDGLFSPDGYYNEGPYYTRYALLPFYLFANAINHVKPELNIFEYRNRILKKALDVALQLTNTNGEFFSFNDALKDKTYQSNEVVNAVDFAWQAYGADSSYLPVCKAQNRVVLCKGGADISAALNKVKSKKIFYPYTSAEYTDGADGKKGGVAILRAGKSDNLSTLIYKYSSHGLSHGHYDKLNIQYYDKGNEILQDYGAVRYINIEQKWGGRYLPETNSYAQQTIAHNTITVDEKSHFNGVEKISEQHHADKMYGNVNGKNLKVMAAMDDHAYNNVKLFRTVYMITIPGTDKTIVADIFKTQSDSIHQYDLPLNFLGTVMSTNFKYHYNTNLTTLGNSNGYQHLWVEAASEKVSPFTQLTFLNHKTFYTISSLSSDSTQIYFTRTGANDSNFNLRRDPSYILRAKNKNQTFINVIEPHGSFNPITEIAMNSKSSLMAIERLQDDTDFTVVKIKCKEGNFLIIQSNNKINANYKHVLAVNGKEETWSGPYFVTFNDQKLQ